MSESQVNKLQKKIYLYGPSGSGKTTVGKILAESLNQAFVDLDKEIEKQAGREIAAIFAEEGEVAFRTLETQILSALIRSNVGVVALGGGTLTVPGNRSRAEASGIVMVLQADMESLASRLETDEVVRPLLVGDQNTRLRAYLADRNPHYASFPNVCDTVGKTPEAVAWEIQVKLGRFHLQGMASHKHPGYDLSIVPGGLDSLGGMLAQQRLRGPVVVVTDENVGGYYRSRVLESLSGFGYEALAVTIQPGEKNKTLETISHLWEAFLASRVERGSTVVALGGGVVGDLAGFAAATYLRGVFWVSVPTSLLAMVDAGVGGKTGFDLPHGKNLVGAFHPPRLVLVDPKVLSTLPEVEFRNGMAEVFKHGVIDDPGLVEQCRSAVSHYLPAEIFGILSRAIAVKTRIIEQDPYERGIRAALNYGHTVGHGVELASDFTLRHGEAVSIGMVVEAWMAERLGLASNGLVEQITKVLTALGLPVEIPPDLDCQRITQAMKRDKKIAASQLRFALPTRMGEVMVGVEVAGWEKYIEDWKKRGVRW